ncbi:MAG: flagellar hook-associated protein FlgK [Planctomycetes bacterium]|nr:flagellar hook-associated protein FlgK [Planctomycetota bacterium]
MSNVGLNIGLKALLTAQTSLDNVGHNISNASTPGYSRQHVLISADPAITVRGLAIGNGVSAQSILRTVDALVQRRLVQQQGSISQLNQRLTGMSQVESLFSEPSDNGLNNLMQGFYTSLSSLSSSPDDLVQRTGVVQAAQSLTGRLNELTSSLSSARKDNASAVAAQVSQVNTLTTQISKLNQQIAAFEGGGAPANDLRDQRDEALKSLSKLVNISTNEGPDGYVTVLTNGALIVGKTKAYTLSATVSFDGTVTIKAGSSPKPVNVSGGSIGGLMSLSQNFVPDLMTRLNALAHSLIGASNHAHSTGIPSAGPFQSLTGTNSVQDKNNNGDLGDELLSNAGLPFDVQGGALYVNMTNRSNGTFTSTRIDIDPASTTVRDLLTTLNSIPHLNASLDSNGRLQMTANSGFGFDFSSRLNPHPDTEGTLGGGAASLGTSGSEPFSLAGGDTLTIGGPAGAFTVTLDQTQFSDITKATAAEIAAAINSDSATATSGMRAVAQDGHLFLQSLTTGSTTSFTVNGGTALGALGWSAGTTATGQDNSVSPTLSGVYTGTTNTSYTLVPSMDGEIGTTPGLTMDVLDASGLRVASLDVGSGYQPGTSLALPTGLNISFGVGSVSATNGDQLTIEALADSDTSHMLVALGVNSLFTGTDAADISVNQSILSDPRNFAASGSGASSDNTALRALIDTRDLPSSALGGVSTGEYYGNVVGGIGFEIDSTSNASQVEQTLLDSLQSTRDQTSGVNMDEELVNMLRFQQTYTAASRYITAVNSTNDDLMRMI